VSSYLMRPRLGQLQFPSVLFGAVAALCTTASLAGAQGISFGPVGEGPGKFEGYDRSFVKEWQANPPKGFTTASKANIAPTKAAIKRYEKIVSSGGFTAVPNVEMQAGLTDPAVALLRRRLQESGDLDQSATNDPNSFDGSLETAVKRFQASNGLAPTGIIDKRTIAALNVPARVRLKQLNKNLTRLTGLARATRKGRYVLVNIPAAQVEVVENDKIVSRHAGVVGKVERPTPLLRSTITQLNFNPVWRLPPTVIKEDLIPTGRRMQEQGKNVLLKYGIDAYSGGKKLDPEKINWASSQPFKLSYRQAPGKGNPLGFLKINFANSSSVYMHDSPKESVFGRNFRAASSGCIRVQNIEELAFWLLKGQTTWEPYHIERLKEQGTTRNVRLKRPVKLYFAYFTAWATPDGVVQFRRDIYQKDGVGEIAAVY